MCLSIGIDLDGVCYDFVDALRQYAAGHHGKPLWSMPEAATWTFYKDQWGWTTEEFREICDLGVDRGHLFKLGTPIDGALAGMKALSEFAELHIITNRFFGSRSAANTKAWLDAWGFPYDSLTFDADKTVVETHLFIEDSPENVEALKAAGTDARLIDRPWNRWADHLPRHTSWSDFVGYAERVYADIQHDHAHLS